MQCGYLTVPENRSKPDGKKIKVFVARVPAASPTPQPDPIVWLAGGPGGAGSFQVTELTRQGLNADRDVLPNVEDFRKALSESFAELSAACRPEVVEMPPAEIPVRLPPRAAHSLAAQQPARREIQLGA